MASGNSDGDDDYEDDDRTSWSPNPDAYDRRGHLPSCKIIYMTIGILLKMLVSDRGGAAAAAEDVNDGGLSNGDDEDDVDEKE